MTINNIENISGNEFQTIELSYKKEYWNQFIISLLPHLTKFNRSEEITKINNLFRNYSSLKTSDFLFFKEYLNDLSIRNKEYLREAFDWFIEQSSSSWLIDNNSIINIIIPSMLPKEEERITKFYSKCFHTLGLKLNKLNFNEFEQFYKHIDSSFSNEQKKQLVIFLTPSLKDVYFNILFDNIKTSLDPTTKELIGKSLCNNRIFDIDLTYLNFIKLYLTEHIENKNTGIDFGRQFTLNKLNIYVALYDELDPEYRNSFINYALSQYYLTLTPQSENILKNIFELRKKDSRLIDANILILLTWRVLNIFPANKKTDFFNMILQHVSQTGELDWLKKTINYHNIIKFVGNTIDTSNVEFQKQLRNHMNYTLNKELPTNIEKSKRIKI